MLQGAPAAARPVEAVRPCVTGPGVCTGGREHEKTPEFPGVLPRLCDGAFLYDKSVSVKALKDAEHLRLFLYNKGVIGTAWAFLDQSIRKINCRPSLVVSIRLSRLKDKRLSCHEPN